MKLLKSISKLFVKNKYNNKQTNIMTETENKIKQFQWKKGETFGEIETVSSEDDKFYYFESGGQIFKNVIAEFMEPVLNGKIPFPPTKPTVTTKESTPTRHVAKAVDDPKSSPIEELVKKLSKKNIEKFETSINLNIPNKDIFNMLVSNADEDPSELIKVIARVAVAGIEINKLQEYLTEEVTNFINNYYNE